jgi:3-hydroxyacyl-CoA dehydrogenase
MRIRKVGVIGAGTMGGGIAALAASVGVPVVLLDIPGAGGDRNGPVKQGVDRALKSKPAAFMDRGSARLIEIGNTEDDLEKLAGCDLVIEAIIEQIAPKRALYERLEELLSADAVIATNTSGIPIGELADGRSASFRRRFLGAHFFNPPRYLHLLELIPTPATESDVLAATENFGDRILGKGVVVAKDSPGFIANRLGVFGSVMTMRLMEEHDLTIDEVDTLNGPLVGRPRSATFRTADLSGLDILKAVREGLSQATGEDLRMPAFADRLVEQGKLGEKTGAGFYTREGKQILTLDWKTGEYRPQEKPEIPGLAALLRQPLAERLRGVLALPGKYGDFANALHAHSWHYTLEKTPEIAYDLLSVDRALEWGFALELGPFRQMDAVGLVTVREILSRQGLPEPELLRLAGRSFYRENGQRTFVGFDGRSVVEPETPGTVQLSRVRRTGRVLEENDDASLLDLGDGVALLEFRSKMGTLGDGVMRVLRSGLERVEKEGRAGLVIGHEDPRAFSAGANLVFTLNAAREKRWKEYDGHVSAFQNTIAAIQRAPFPVVAAPFGLTLGGGAEISLHSSRVQAHAELYIGLVETGVGLLPAGGGTKELLFRFTEELAPYEEANPFDAIRRAFGLIAMAKTSGSALEARGMGLLRPADRITINRHRLIADAKTRVLDLAPDYVAPTRGTITALGKKAIGNLHYAIWAMREAGQITDHEVLIATEVAYVLCGGDGLPREVTEQDILDLEREAFLKLLGTKKTQERIEYTLENGKPLRN